MNNTVSVSNFGFYKFNHQNYHYTDNMCGSPMNYIACMLKGTAKIVADSGAVDVNEGDIFFIPYKLRYRSYWYGTPEICFLSYGFFSIEASEKINFDLQVVKCDTELKNLICKIPTEGNCISSRGLSLFYAALAELIPYLKKSKKISKKQQTVDNVKKYILEHPECSMSEAAEKCFISTPYLYMCFKEKACCSPNEYRLKAISRRCVEQLITTDKTVDAISAELGLSSASHLRRILKKYTGKTPREIRKNREI